MYDKKIMKNIFILVIFLLAAFNSHLVSQDLNDEPKEISPGDKLRIAEAFKIASHIGDDIWSGWENIPFIILLVTNEYEFLINHPQPSDDFIFTEYDSLLKSMIYYRNRVFPANFLATFPAVRGMPTVVIGQPENTEANSSTRWVITLMHEHFHQLQYSQKDYYINVNSLDISGGDETGMWMLNYPFPYDSAIVKKSFSLLCGKLWNALNSYNGNFEEAVEDFLTERKRFKEILSSNDYKYFSFQLWQEGISRYTEYAVARKLEESYTPSEAYLNLNDYSSFKEDADKNYSNILTMLTNIDLSKLGRIAFYYIGAAEGILLDLVNPSWKDKYFSDMFYLEEYYNSQR
jgi:hypothetical protein